jgi:phosphonoacetaldehyde hydrolase
MAIELVVFDWAGTLVDFGCCAPLAAFLEGFAAAGLPITEAIARGPMGAHKRDHIVEIVYEPAMAQRIRAELDREPDDSLIAEIYEEFCRLLPAALPRHAAPIPGVVETLGWLRSRGIRIGSTTGYTRAMMDVLEPIAHAAGVSPEALICSDEVPQARPAPWACFRLAERFGVYPMSRCVKVGDTPADIAEGISAGMIPIGISATGNEVGLSQAALNALSEPERARRIAAAEQRLLAAGAKAVLPAVADLPRWIEQQAS